MFAILVLFVAMFATFSAALLLLLVRLREVPETSSAAAIVGIITGSRVAITVVVVFLVLL